MATNPVHLDPASEVNQDNHLSHFAPARCLFHVFELKGHTPGIAMFQIGEKRLGIGRKQQPVSDTLWQFNPGKMVW